MSVTIKMYVGRLKIIRVHIYFFSTLHEMSVEIYDEKRDREYLRINIRKRVVFNENFQSKLPVLYGSVNKKSVLNTSTRSNNVCTYKGWYTDGIY